MDAAMMDGNFSELPSPKARRKINFNNNNDGYINKNLAHVHKKERPASSKTLHVKLVDIRPMLDRMDISLLGECLSYEHNEGVRRSDSSVVREGKKSVVLAESSANDNENVKTADDAITVVNPQSESHAERMCNQVEPANATNDDDGKVDGQTLEGISNSREKADEPSAEDFNHERKSVHEVIDEDYHSVGSSSHNIIIIIDALDIHISNDSSMADYQTNEETSGNVDVNTEIGNGQEKEVKEHIGPHSTGGAANMCESNKGEENDKNGNAEKRFQCTICKKCFTCTGSVTLHMRIHKGEKPHRCKFCDKSFSQLGNLKRHLVVHSGKKPFKCRLCANSFSQVSNLKSHMMTHTGKKPYECCICGKSFTQPHSLKEHKLTHTGEKPHKCKVCGKSFAQSGNLNSHMKVHDGVKPHKCEVCGWAFSRAHHLKRHILTHSGEPKECKYCNKSFKYDIPYEKHMKNHTEIKAKKRQRE